MAYFRLENTQHESTHKHVCSDEIGSYLNVSCEGSSPADWLSDMSRSRLGPSCRELVCRLGAVKEEVEERETDSAESPAAGWGCWGNSSCSWRKVGVEGNV